MATELSTPSSGDIPAAISTDDTTQPVIIDLANGMVQIPRVAYPIRLEDLAPEDRGFNTPPTTARPESLQFSGHTNYPTVYQRARGMTPNRLEEIIADPEANDLRADLFGMIGQIRREVHDAQQDIVNAINSRIQTLQVAQTQPTEPTRRERNLVASVPQESVANEVLTVNLDDLTWAKHFVAKFGQTGLAKKVLMNAGMSKEAATTLAEKLLAEHNAQA